MIARIRSQLGLQARALSGWSGKVQQAAGSKRARRRTCLAALSALALLAAGSPAAEDLEIVISEGRDNPARIAVVPFDASTAPVASGMADIIAFDLLRSGQFSTLARENMLSYPATPEDVFFRDWRIVDMDYLLIGRADLEPNGDLGVAWHLYDVTAGRELLWRRLVASPVHMRDVAHRIADDAYAAITGVRGAFSTRILYVLVQNPGTSYARYQLRLADSDGERARTVFESTEPVMSPGWSPDGARIAYVSFETGKSSIVVHDLGTDERRIVANFEGINGAPAFSPDGNTLAMSLSRDGNSEIYTQDIATGALRRVTRHPGAIDTEPTWNAAGDALIFTSDRGRRPQIYQVDLATLFVERLTFHGDYNARARLLPDQRHLIYVHRRDGIYHIAWKDLERDDLPRVLTATSLDESPSVAPNGAMLIYATQDGGRGILAVVSIDGGATYQLRSASGDVREPTWSPFLDTTRVVSSSE